MRRDPLSPRLAGFGTTVFAEMSQLASAHDAVNLGQGFPDADGPPEVLDAAVAAIRSGRNQYPPGNGVAELRHAIAAHQARFWGLSVDPDTEALVTAGATEAIAASVLGTVSDGDEVIVFDPAYDSYRATIAMAGAVAVPVALHGPDHVFEPAELRAAVTPRTRAVLVNTPHNPTGTVLGPALLDEIATVACDHDLLVISDEVYEHLTFDGVVHVPLATRPGMAERTITISSGGKTFNTTGWKVGWLTGPAPLVAAARTAKQFLTYVASGPFQPAIAVGLGLPDAYFAHLAAGLADRRDRLVAGLVSLGLDPTVPAAGYFVVTDVSPIAGDESGTEFCRRLPERCGVAAIPVEVFHDPSTAAPARSVVRFAFCKAPEVIDEAVTRLATLT